MPASLSDPVAPESPSTSSQALRAGVVLWLMGLPGVVALAWTTQAAWMTELAAAYPGYNTRGWVLVGLSILLALAVWIGGALGSQVGLGTPLISAIVQGRSPWRGIRFLSLPGVAGGVAGAAWLVTLAMFWPERVTVIDPVYSLPLLSKILYGGWTEELLLRYGAMSMVMWLLWKTFGDAHRRPGWQIGWWAVVISAALAAALPAYLAWPLSSMDLQMLVQLLLCEIVYGLLAGFLFWRYGLESAMLAHWLMYLLSHGLV